MSGPRRTPKRRPDPSGRPAGTRTRPGERATARVRITDAGQPKARYTNRMAVFLLVVAVLVISYASSMRAFVRQSSQIHDLKAQIASSQKQIASMKGETSRWKDPAFIEEQARQRFGWVVAGETGYQVIGSDGKELSGTGRLDSPVQPVHKPTAWWSAQYDSLRAADHPAVKKKAPTPLTTITPKTTSKTPSTSGG
jgi:cell division protein FtsB